jgi:hypothetical protein
MSSHATPTDRGCGRRVRGGIYLEIGMGRDGTPIENLLIDHPIPVPVKRLGIMPRGVRLVEWLTGPMLVDWVGSNYYPNVLDFVEEARRFGISRRLPRNLDWKTLAGANLVFLHARAAVENPDTFWSRISKTYCPIENAVHMGEGYRKAGGPCAGFWWDDVEGGEPIESENGARIVRRRMPSFTYLARSRPIGADPIYTPAMFMLAPSSAGRLVYVREYPGDGIPAELARDIAASGLTIEAVDE